MQNQVLYFSIAQNYVKWYSKREFLSFSGKTSLKHIKQKSSKLSSRFAQNLRIKNVKLLKISEFTKSKSRPHINISIIYLKSLFLCILSNYTLYKAKSWLKCECVATGSLINLTSENLPWASTLVTDIKWRERNFWH